MVKFVLSFLEFVGRPFYYVLLFTIFFLTLVGSATLKILSLTGRLLLEILFFPITFFYLIGQAVKKLWILSISAAVSLRPKKLKRLPLPTKPIHVYTAPKPLFTRPRLKIPPLGITFFSFVVLVIGISCLSFWYVFLRDLPAPSVLTTRHQALTTRIFDRKGRLLYKFYKNENRTLIPLPEIPLHLRQATITIEDKDFYSHPGISPRGIVSALWRNISTGSVTGGSTITQQLVKNALLTPQKSWTRKIREAVLAIEVEFRYTKDQILEMYLNEVPYGGSTYGVSEAAETYFGKRVQDLSLAESAFLAGLPASPTDYSPYGEHPELAKARERQVLGEMVQRGYITQGQADLAAAEKLELRPPNIHILAPHFVMYVRSLLVQKYGNQIVDQGGLQVFTSLDLDVQDTVQKIVTDEVKKVNFLHITQGAALVTNPATGEILAMVGSKDYFDTTQNGNVNATLALRQPGSSIKPVNYAVALSNGFTPATIIPDTPITFQTPGQPPYSPVNYDGKSHGNVPLRIALASSYNVPAVKVLAAVGLTRMIDQGRKMGITTWKDPSRYGLSLTLGGGDVYMTDLSVVYGTLANMGARVDLHPILRIDDSQGHILEKDTCTDAVLPSPITNQGFLTQFPLPPGEPTLVGCDKQPVLDPRVAYMLSSILSDNNARAPAFGSHSDLVIPGHQVPVKTGTTNNLKDNWTIGYTRNLLAAVWVGNFDSSPMSYVASGVTGASPIWRKIMTTLLSDKPDTPFAPPQDIVKAEVCEETGTLSCRACPTKRTEYFLPDTVPTQVCSDNSIKKYLEEKQKASPSPSPSPSPNP